MKFKEFWKKYSYATIKHFVNQFAIAIFGLVLAIACGMAKNTALQLVASGGAILFYLFLLYALTWDVGSKDKLRVDTGREPPKYLTGLYISLLANIPNFLLAILVVIGMIGADGSVLSKTGAAGASIALFIEGMYTGMLTLPLAGAPLNSYWPTFFLLPVPALVVCTLGYIFGLRGYHLTGILLSDTPEDIERKKEEKAKRKL